MPATTVQGAETRRDAAFWKRIPRYWEAPLYARATFLIFVVARYIVLGARRDWLATLRVEMLLGLAMIGICIMLAAGQGFPYGRARFIIVSIGLLFFAMIVQMPFAADPARAEFIMNERVMKFAVLTFFIAVMVHSPRTMDWFMLAFLFSCFYVTQESVRGLISGSLVWENQGVQRLHGAVRMYAHPNSLAGLAMGTVPFITFLLPVVNAWWKRGLLLATLTTSLICVIFSGSRTSYVGLVVFAIYWWAVSPRKMRLLFRMLAVMIIALPMVPQEYIQRFESIGGQEAEGHSKEKRIVILEDAWQIFLENPQGVGVASFPAVREARFGRDQDTHNLYLEVATNLGAQGFIIFIMFLVAVFKAYRSTYKGFGRQIKGLRRLAREPDTPAGARKAMGRLGRELAYMQAVAKATAGFVVVRLALGLFGMDLYEPYWWFASGIGISLVMIEHWTRQNCQRIVQRCSTPQV